MLFLIGFFLKNIIRSRRVIWLSVLGLVPVLIALLLVVFPIIPGGRPAVSALFIEMGLTLHVHILLPLVAILIGSSTIAEEVDEGTLAYIMTRPIPKWRFVLSKIVAGCIAASMILILSMCATYTVMRGAAGLGAWLAGLSSLLRAAGVLALGVLAYVGLFSLLGALIKRPVLAGLVFVFGWEKIIAHLPSKMQLLTVVAHLNALYPYRRTEGSEGEIAGLVEQMLQSGGATSSSPTLILLLVFTACMAVTALLLYVREYCAERQ